MFGDFYFSLIWGELWGLWFHGPAVGRYIQSSTSPFKIPSRIPHLSRCQATYAASNGATATTSQSIPADIAQRSTITRQILEGDLASHNIMDTTVEIPRCVIWYRFLSLAVYMLNDTMGWFVPGIVSRGLRKILSYVSFETIPRTNHPMVSLSIYTA